MRVHERRFAAFLAMAASMMLASHGYAQMNLPPGNQGPVMQGPIVQGQGNQPVDPAAQLPYNALPPPNQPPPFVPVVPPSGPGPAVELELEDAPAISSAPPQNLPAGNGVQPQSGFGGFGDMGGDIGGRGDGFGGLHPSDSVRYTVTWFPTVHVVDQPTNFQEINESLSFTHPLWSDERNSISLTGGVRNVTLDTDAVLPDTGQIVPEDLWNVNLGLRFAHQYDNGWMTNGMLSIGSASDHPFASIREMNVSTMAMLRVPTNEHDAWIFSLMYSPTSELDFPIPGVAYSWNPSPQFHANIGLPLQVVWRPTDDWQFQASYMLIRTVHVKSTYRFSHIVRLFAAYDWSNEAYALENRPDENDRFFIYDQRVSMGLELAAIEHWTASIAAGYIFDRYMYEGTSLTGSGSDKVDIGAGPFASLNIGVRF